MTPRPEARMEFVCTAPEEEGEGRHRWMGEAVVKSHSMCMAELFICGRGSCMDAVVGRYKNGQYICIPDLDTGCPLGRLTDTFWNRERLSRHMPEADAITVANALEAVSEYLGGGWV